MKHELIAKDYVLYLIQYYASMQTWSKEQIIGQIVLHIEGEKEDVVRCKDCNKQGECKFAQYQGEEGFCSYGERKDDAR